MVRRMRRSGGSGLGLGFAAIAAVVGCLHCSDDGGTTSSNAAGEGGEPATGGTGAGTAGQLSGNGGSSAAGAAAGGTAPATGGVGGAMPGGGMPPVVDGGAGGAVAGAGGSGDQGGEGGWGLEGGMGGVGGDFGEAGMGGVGGAATVETERFGYVFNSVLMPTSNAEANLIGFDLSGDTIVDNKFGKAMSSLIAMGFLVNPSINTAIQNGSILMLATFDTTSTADAEGARFLTYFGGNASPLPCVAPKDCGYHLSGAATFDIAADNIEGTATVGSVAAGVYRGLGGQLPMRFMFGIEKADILLLDGHVELSQPSVDGFAPGRLGGAIPAKDVDEGIYPAVHKTIKASVAFSCTGTPAPTCGCSANTNGAVFVGALDVNHDCAISLEEVKANPTISALFALDLDRDHDQTADALSCAFAITGKRATFVAP